MFSDVYGQIYRHSEFSGQGIWKPCTAGNVQDVVFNSDSNHGN